MVDVTGSEVLRRKMRKALRSYLMSCTMRRRETRAQGRLSGVEDPS